MVNSGANASSCDVIDTKVQAFNGCVPTIVKSFAWDVAAMLTVYHTVITLLKQHHQEFKVLPNIVNSWKHSELFIHNGSHKSSDDVTITG